MRHNPRCAIFNEPPGLRMDSDCNCGAIPPLEPTITLREHEREVARLQEAIQANHLLVLKQTKRVKYLESVLDRMGLS